MSSTDKKNMSQEEMREVAAKFNEKLLSDQSEDAKAFINEMFEAIQEPKRKIPEPVFREIFLPYFTGEKPMKKGEEAIAHWMGLVGSPTESAEVVDVRGEVLFEVPPMYDSSRINSYRDKNDRKTMANIFTAYVEQASVHRALAMNGLSQDLANQTSYIKPKDENSPSWDKVLAYYGLSEEKVTQNVSSSTNSSDDGFEFDE